ncbi:hypothetical protein BCR43DRAFT_517921 [Syncephalastrum racemosum]|uniref:Uncharacterized protein n=1 Tax=Syncephalastrum racemosum TaxID=13706 RepID=A0A1X2H275_SYNRA|nr:hypothetical protein BCR43DRAFT_517921 [Syncephalastrum racemosum]
MSSQNEKQGNTFRMVACYMVLHEPGELQVAFSDDFEILNGGIQRKPGAFKSILGKVQRLYKNESVYAFGYEAPPDYFVVHDDDSLQIALTLAFSSHPKQVMAGLKEHKDTPTAAQSETFVVVPLSALSHEDFCWGAGVQHSSPKLSFD